jgi:uncharacterized OB-fold protein
MEEIKKGWKCPQCGKIWNPEVKSCPDCKVDENDTNKFTGHLLLE